MTTPTREYQDTTVDVKIVLSGLWVAMLMVFAYVDIFGFYRADVLEAALVGEIAVTGFAVDQTFLVLTLFYVAVPSLMVVLSLLARPVVNRRTNLVLSVFYALTVLGSCIGETWVYYLLGSAIEVALLAVIARTAWRWPLAT